MGRIAPRRKQSRWNPHSLWLTCQHRWGQWRQRRQIPGESQGGTDEGNIDNDHGSAQERLTATPPASHHRVQSLSSWLHTLWHMPDSFSWMAPLPYLHRRCIFIVLGLLLIVLLWPGPAPQPAIPQQVDVPLSQHAPIQAQLVSPLDTPSQTPPPASEANWRTYQVASGQTLAQLFRDNNLPLNDVFAMAQVEGTGKPLSNLRTGQSIRLQRNAQGAITQLSTETSSGQQVLFARQQDGSFIRVN
ncbi:LysM-like peptidoglycan-binding domain-containing protein [Dickeya lacustris]|uniref:Opacity-associated protein A n=1 Tax=Dickeya lacustris TaxID=2259638 RepID=A0ABY8G519_9GAMM|nr:LysM-like peptidoglycan-binding domain-containing protein [Dickeya lacustris]WFN55015.1 Opacity-associated protein A [Dickeya lacustris]